MRYNCQENAFLLSSRKDLFDKNSDFNQSASSSRDPILAGVQFETVKKNEYNRILDKQVQSSICLIIAKLPTKLRERNLHRSRV